MRRDAADSPPQAAQRWLRRLCLASALTLAPFATTAAQTAPKAYLVDLQGAIGPVTADYVVRGLREAADADAAVVVLRIDTPGGLDTSMRAIIRAILASPVPVIGYVAPGGARAASAGTYIMYACSVAAMAPGTNLGAATPVNLFGASPSEKPGDTGTEPSKNKPGAGKPSRIRPPNAELTKITNDAVAYIRGLAKLHGRNADWAERAVREAASLPYDAALKEHVIDLVADDVADLLTRVNGRSIELHGARHTLATAEATVIPVEPSWRTRLLATLTDPNVAYLLMLVGVFGLVFEFSHPGVFAPGVIGSISLLLGLLGLNFLPIDLAGAGLAALGIALMVTEAFVPAFGALGIGGAIAFAIGSLMMFDTPGFRLAWPVVAGATAVCMGLFLVVLAMLIRARRRPPATGEAGLLGTTGEVIAWTLREGEVQTQGERWHARADRPLAAGQQVRIVGRDGLTLKVEPK
jgi:membrane-bound serine protease (ClpP class)